MVRTWLSNKSSLQKMESFSTADSGLDVSLERERLFREDFSRALKAELLKEIDDRLVRERFFREDFSRQLANEISERIDKKLQSRLLRMPVPYAHEDSLLVHTLDGHRLLLDNRESFISMHIIEHGEWETHIRSLMGRILFSGGKFVDVGANIGVHTLLACNLVGPEGRVWALEAHPRTFSFLHQNIEINGLLQRVVHACIAASDADGQILDFEYFPQHPGMSGFRLSAERVKEFAATPEIARVPTTTLDSFIGMTSPIDLVKIDVEGFELKVIQGATRLLSQHDTCFMIEYDFNLVSSVSSVEEAVLLPQIFKKFGYKVFGIPNEGNLVPLNIDDFKQFPYGDLLFVHPEGKHAKTFFQ